MSGNDKKGFSLVEALIGLLLFNMILAIFLPTIILEIQRHQQVIEESKQWQIFYDLYQGRKNPETITHMVSHYNAYAENPIVAWSLEEFYCYVSFSEGEEIYVQLWE